MTSSLKEIPITPMSTTGEKATDIEEQKEGNSSGKPRNTEQQAKGTPRPNMIKTMWGKFTELVEQQAQKSHIRLRDSGMYLEKETVRVAVILVTVLLSLLAVLLLTLASPILALFYNGVYNILCYRWTTKETTVFGLVSVVTLTSRSKMYARFIQRCVSLSGVAALLYGVRVYVTSETQDKCETKA